MFSRDLVLFSDSSRVLRRGYPPFVYISYFLYSQLLPHAASIVRLISVYFEKCALPELRTKIYSITKILLISMGVGM